MDLGLPLVFYYLHCPPSLRLERGARALEAGDSGRAALYRREGLALGVGGGKEGGFACMRTRQTTQSTHREHTHTHTHTHSAQECRDQRITVDSFKHAASSLHPRPFTPY